MLAEWLADCQMTDVQLDLKKMLLNGQRGFLAMHEKELTNLFDKKYAELETKKDALIEEMKKYENRPNYAWEYQTTKNQVEKIAAQLSAADIVYNEIFEEVFL